LIKINKLTKKKYDNLKSNIGHVSKEYAEILDLLLNRVLEKSRKKNTTKLFIFLSVFYTVLFYQSSSRLSSKRNKLLFVDFLDRNDHASKYNKWKSFFNTDDYNSLEKGNPVSILNFFDRLRVVFYFFKNFCKILKIANILNEDLKGLLLIIKVILRFELDKQLAYKVCKFINCKVICSLSLEMYPGFYFGVRKFERNHNTKVKIIVAQHGILIGNNGFPEERLSDVFIVWNEKDKKQTIKESIYEPHPEMQIACSLDIPKIDYQKSFGNDKILFISSPAQDNDIDLDKEIMKIIITQNENFKKIGLKLKIRLHPSVKIKDYSFLDDTLIENSRECSLSESFNDTRVVLGYFSTAMIEASLKGIKCFQVIPKQEFVKSNYLPLIDHIVEDELINGAFVNKLKYKHYDEVNISDIVKIQTSYFGDINLISKYKTIVEEFLC